MSVDASLLIENPWTVALLCMLSLLGVLAAITAIGSLVAKVLGVAKPDTFGLFVRMLIGLVSTTVLYAIVKSGGQTSLIPLVIFGVAAFLITPKSTSPSTFKLTVLISKKQLLFVLSASCISFLLFLTLVLNFKTGQLRFLGAGEAAQFIDFPFTVRAGQLLNFCGIESISTNFFDTSQLRPTPYHWLEIWFGALIYTVIPLNAEVLWSCVVNPVLFTTLLVGVYGLLERIVGSKPFLGTVAFLILVVSGFGILYPSQVDFFSATLRAESILETPKYAIAYLFAIPVAEGMYNGRYKLLPYLFVLFGLSYLPIIPVASMLSFAAIVLRVWSIRENKNQAIKEFASWTTAYLLLAAWFYWFYSNSQISYTAGSGASSGVLSMFNPVLSTKVFVHMLIQMFLTNIPYIAVLVGLLLIGKNWLSLKETIAKRGPSLILVALFYPTSVLGYVMIYGMTNSVQVWTVSYQSLHYVMLVGLMGVAIYHHKLLVNVLAGLVILATTVFNFNVNLGIGNEIASDELRKIQEFTSSQQEGITHFAYIGDARYGNDGAGGLFDLSTDIFYPFRELGILTSPYSNACLSVFDIPLSSNLEQRAKQQRVLSHGPFYQYVEKQTDVENLSESDLANYKARFIQEFDVKFIVVPFDQELTTELANLVGEFIEVNDGRIYRVL
ncbi:MAG: hypothetical protein ACI9CU_000708 [Polaribacter sp.]|jgi:hypothetical protein